MEQTYKHIDEFLSYHSQEIRPIACVTSGGTVVPLSARSSHSLDNFSLGERGANSVEYFLAKGYVVIFLHRLEARFPFSKNTHHHFSDRINHQLLSKVRYQRDEESGATTLLLQDHHLTEEQKGLVQMEGKILRNVIKYRYFLPISFQTIEEYLALLEYLGKALAFFGPRVCFYLAAAVSDFYIPSAELAAQTDLQQRTEEELVLPLQQVPKMLGRLTREWAPNAFVISFKLETDHQILLQKAQKAIEKYGVHLVIANLLHERRNTCILVAKKEDTAEGFEYETVHRDQKLELYIEKQLIDAVLLRHHQFIADRYALNFRYDNPQTEATEREQNQELLRLLLEKIFEHQKTLICQQIQYYLTYTNSKQSEEQESSVAFQPAVSTHVHSNQESEVVPRVMFRKQYTPLLGGVTIMVGLTLLKVFTPMLEGSF